MATADDNLAQAHAAFEAGFLSMAAKSRALGKLNRAYSAARDALSNAILAKRSPENEKQNHEDYWAIPLDLHHVRERHFELAARYEAGFEIVRDLLNLRAAIKEAEITPAPARPENEERADTVRRTIVEEMERRRALYIQGLEIAHLFGGLAVSVNAHWVHGHKGAVFLRHFYYLYGRLTPLQTIMAVADTYERTKTLPPEAGVERGGGR